MRNVKRLPVPGTLRDNSEQWKTDLLDAIVENKATGKEIPKGVYNKYKQDDVLETLKQMYSDGYGTYYCCYCESPIEPVSFPHIEHRKPKHKHLFPEETFNWDNLHLVCETCNVKKGTKWDDTEEILDACHDVPIENHLCYKVEIPEGVYRDALTGRGITTVEHTELDRPPLRLARLKIWHAMIEKIREIKSSDAEPKKHTAKKILVDKCNGHHGSLIKWLLQEWNVI